MVTLPLALLLGVGMWISLAKGKGSPWFGFLAVAFGIVIANTQLGKTLIGPVTTTLTAAGTTGANAGLAG